MIRMRMEVLLLFLPDEGLEGIVAKLFCHYHTLLGEPCPSCGQILQVFQ